MLEATSASAVSTTEAPSVPALPQSEAAISDHNTVAWCLEDKVLIDCLGFFKSHASHSRNVGGAAHRGTSRWGMGRHYHTNSWNWPKLSDLLSKHSLEGGSLQIYSRVPKLLQSQSQSGSASGSATWMKPPGTSYLPSSLYSVFEDFEEIPEAHLAAHMSVYL